MPHVGQAPSADGNVELRAAALDAYRVSKTTTQFPEKGTKRRRYSTTCVFLQKINVQNTSASQGSRKHSALN